AIAFIPPRIHTAGLHCTADSASRLAHVTTIREPASGCEVLDLHESQATLVEAIHRGREVPYAGRANQWPSAGHVDHVRGRGVMASVFFTHESTCFNLSIWNEPLND